MPKILNFLPSTKILILEDLYVYFDCFPKSNYFYLVIFGMRKMFSWHHINKNILLHIIYLL